MHRFSFLGAALPVLALAACSDSNSSGTLVAPLETEATAAMVSRGALIAQSICASCHGADFGGSTNGVVACPSLKVAQEYSQEEFDALLNAGLARDGEVVDPFMPAGWSLPDEDRVALHQYLLRLRDL